MDEYRTVPEARIQHHQRRAGKANFTDRHVVHQCVLFMILSLHILYWVTKQLQLCQDVQMMTWRLFTPKKSLKKLAPNRQFPAKMMKHESPSISKSTKPIEIKIQHNVRNVIWSIRIHYLNKFIIYVHIQYAGWPVIPSADCRYG